MLTLPYHRFRIIVEGDAASVSSALVERTEARYRWLRTLPPQTWFVGRIDGTRFKLIPVVHGRNSYAPLMRGTVQSSDGRTTLEGTMTLHPVVAGAVIVLAAFPQWWSVRSGGGVSLLWLGVIAVFHVVMYYVGFAPEVRKVEARLRSITA